MNLLTLDVSEIRNMPETAVILLAYIRGTIDGNDMDISAHPHLYSKQPEVVEMAKQGWHCITGKDIEKNLGMGPWKYVKYLKWLVKAKYIKIKRHGLPAKRWIYLLKQPHRK